jgi:hypothetical protein
VNTTRGRLVTNNSVVFDQADFFQPDEFTRVSGITVGQLTSQLFFQNALQPWSLLSGVGVTNAQVTSGRVYWSEVPGSPGVYSVRLLPNAVGYWRLILTYPVGTQIVSLDYDVVAGSGGSCAPGLQSSFIKPGC